ncbi:unnamed protein product [Knipowitschia caucasica]|uniref:5'-(N(7)-methylguanosine 5'-triphospho)-[mRNA] hydrolase n=2 Tax=Knipowitschia caucasica TaxID=637954 RepID=A0AAV2IUS4_KNICA
MTATCAGSSLVAKGLDISLAALKRQDPYINDIVDVASQVALYTYNNRANEWEKTEVEGTLFIYTRLASPRHGFTIMNRLSMENLTEPITKDLDFQLQDPFLLYRNARLMIHGIWFYDKEDCQRIAQRMKFLTQLELVPGQSHEADVAPEGSQGKPVDIIQMLSKARNEYDKENSSSEPKEIGGSSMLYGNPNLIKPIPVKPNTQESERSLSLATLFGTQHKVPTSPLDPAASSSLALSNPSTTMAPTDNTARPHVVRALTYENKARSGESVTQSALEGGGLVHDLPQHCPAIQKLMQGQREVLQTVSESPENRLCDNGHQMEQPSVFHHPHLHHLNAQQTYQQIQGDPIKRLFQSQPPAPPMCPQHQSQPMVFNRAHDYHIAAHLAGFPLQMPGVLSPHELLQKLQIVQQEQIQTLPDPPHTAPVPAPRFMGLPQSEAKDPGLSQLSTHTPATVGQKAALQFQVISPQRIPATVAPTMLLSPSVFSQTKPSPASVQLTRSGPANPTQILSRSQLKAALLHLIQNDGSFLDSIYEAYTGRFSSDSSCKY